MTQEPVGEGDDEREDGEGKAEEGEVEEEEDEQEEMEPFQTARLSTPTVRRARKQRDQGKTTPAAAATPTPATGTSGKKTSSTGKHPLPPSEKTPSKKPKVINLVGGAGPSSSSAVATRVQDIQYPDDKTVVIGTFRARDSKQDIFETNHQVVAFFEDVPAGSPPSLGNLRLEALPWTTTNDPSEFGLVEEEEGTPWAGAPGGGPYGQRIPTNNFRLVTLKEFYHERSFSDRRWTADKLFEVVRSELRHPWHRRH